MASRPARWLCTPNPWRGLEDTQKDIGGDTRLWMVQDSQEILGCRLNELLAKHEDHRLTLDELLPTGFGRPLIGLLNGIRNGRPGALTKQRVVSPQIHLGHLHVEHGLAAA
jgi:hypothetical protein